MEKSNNNNIERLYTAIFKRRQGQSRPFQFDMTGEYINYWFSLPKKGLTPQKSSIDPRGMIRMLPGAIMLEKDPASGGYRIRLFGTGNVTRWGFEATNADYMDLLPPQHRNAISKKFAQSIEYPCGLILSGDELYTSGRIIRNEMALFPMHADDPGKAILFGLITAAPDQHNEYANDVLASVFYTISATHYVNIGAGVPG
ncbi:MAG: PAS domain-containing protein [Alphaproteobacteria bacterium]